MTIKQRLAAWWLFGRVADALGISRAKLKEVLSMQPFPKWVGYLAALAATAAAAFTALHPGAPLPGWITTITTLVAAFSHSATGNGGK